MERVTHRVINLKLIPYTWRLRRAGLRRVPMYGSLVMPMSICNAPMREDVFHC